MTDDKLAVTQDAPAMDKRTTPTQQGCAQSHYGSDCEQFGIPQWLVDSRARIAHARALGAGE